MIDIKDRIIQYPSRYELTEVSTGIYDLTQVTGTVTDEGTPINKTLFDDIYKSNIASFLAFCGNVNANMLDGAFGKNVEDYVFGIGRQLAMYAWFKGDSKTTYPFSNLLTKNHFADCIADENSLSEIFSNDKLVNLISASPYASSLYNSSITSADKLRLTLIGCNLAPLAYSTLSSLMANVDAPIALVNKTGLFTYLTSQAEGKLALYDNANAYEPLIRGNSNAIAKLSSMASETFNSGNLSASTAYTPTSRKCWVIDVQWLYSMTINTLIDTCPVGGQYTLIGTPTSYTAISKFASPVTITGSAYTITNGERHVRVVYLD